MSNIDKQALREAAEKATPGPWRMALTKFNGITHGKFSFTKEDIIASSPEKRNSIFIAAANPATVLALLDELEAKDKQIADLKEAFSIALSAAGIDATAAAGKGE